MLGFCLSQRLCVLRDSYVICRLDYRDGDSLIVLSCKHSYHSECINNWLQISKMIWSLCCCWLERGTKYGLLVGSVSPMTGEHIKSAYGGDEEAFLKKVVTPIYNIIAKETKRSKEGKSKHSQWLNYDDLNEYFWSVNCFRLGWPMRADADFFCIPIDQVDADRTEEKGDQSIGKITFVEIRSFWHIFRSYDRMWSFYILALQAMIIIAWNGTSSVGDIFEGDVFKKVLSIIISAAVLKLAHGKGQYMQTNSKRHI